MVFFVFRLNVFGFFVSEEFVVEVRNYNEFYGNMGLWDQRIVLEWIYINILLFGGDFFNIIVVGYLVGGFLVFQYLVYDLYCVLVDKCIIRRFVMFLNGLGIMFKILVEQ